MASGYSRLNHSDRSRCARACGVFLVVLVAAVGLALVLFHVIEKRWIWQPAKSSSPAYGVGASSVTLTPNPVTDLYDPGWVNAGAAYYSIVNDSTGPNGLQYRATVTWSIPDDTDGIGGYQVFWQWGSPTHLGTYFQYLSQDGGQTSMVDASQHQVTFTPLPGYYSNCPSCVYHSDDACFQAFVVSCTRANDPTSCGRIPGSNSGLPYSLACYNPSVLYGYNACCNCPGYCLTT